MKYYYDLLSQPSRALYIFLTKNKISFQKCPIALRKGEHRTSEYEKINPLKLVPAIDDDGFRLSESIAILRYIMKKYKDQIPEHWYPKDAKTQAKVDQYLEWQHTNTRLNCALFFQHKLVIPLITQAPPDEAKIALFQERMESTLETFEKVWLKDGNYIAGSHLSLADLLAICELQQPSIVGYDVLKSHPKLTVWYNRVRNELEPEFSEASAILEKVKKQYAEGEIQLPKANL